MELYKRIGIYCVEHGITRGDFAEKLGMSYASLWSKCHGRTKFSVGEAYALSQLIDVSVGELLKMI